MMTFLRHTTLRHNLLLYKFYRHRSGVLKLEINTTEHFSVYGNKNVPFQVESGWFDGKCQIPTYQLEELLGTKMRALYQRSKGRDLFDLDYAMQKRANLDWEKVVRCFCEYLHSSRHYIPTSNQMKLNLVEKLKNTDFAGDTAGLLRGPAEWDIQLACDNILPVVDLLDRVRDDYMN